MKNDYIFRRGISIILNFFDKFEYIIKLIELKLTKLYWLKIKKKIPCPLLLNSQVNKLFVWEFNKRDTKKNQKKIKEKSLCHML